MSGDLQNFTKVGECRKHLQKPQYLCLIPGTTEMINLLSGLEQSGSILPSPHQLSKRLSKGSKQTVADEPRSGSGSVTKFI